MCVQVVCEQVRGGGGRRRRRAGGGQEADGMQNQKQEPHTKMWGTTYSTASNAPETFRRCRGGCASTSFQESERCKEVSATSRRKQEKQLPRNKSKFKSHHLCRWAKILSCRLPTATPAHGVSRQPSLLFSTGMICAKIQSGRLRTSNFCARRVKAASSNCNLSHVLSQAPSANPVPQVPRLPRKVTIHVIKCHACHTK